MSTRNTGGLLFAVLTCCSIIMANQHARAGSITITYVANNGVDSSSCGDRDRPCRSITQALANAPVGTTILVGPGRYGDVDGDGRFESPGDERAQRGQYSLGSFFAPQDISCVVCITKPIRVLSMDGAAATIIDAGGSSYHVVQITANNVLFGDVNRGFTLTGAVRPDNFQPGGNGLLLHGNSVRIIGNTARGNAGEGFNLLPGGEPPVRTKPPQFTSAGRILVAHNIATDNLGIGFIVGGVNPITLDNNTSTGNGKGVVVFGGAPDVITHNMVSGNGAGIDVEGGPFQFTHNVVTSNNLFGFSFFDHSEILTGSNVLQLNDIIGNGGAGVTIEETTVGVTLSQNNICGNGFLDHSNCGIAVFHNSADAVNNYWGSKQGPGADPADTVGVEPFCDGTIPPNGEAGLPGTKPFATQPFGVL
jgi:hypothetical protein